MRVAIPPAFEAFARQQVAAGIVASEEDAVTAALLDYLDEVEALRALVDPALAALDRGEGVDGPTFMRELLAQTDAGTGGSTDIEA